MGLARIYTVLRATGYAPIAFDLDTWLKGANMGWYRTYQSAYNIGREFERVSFILGPEAILHSLYRKDFPELDWQGLLEHAKVRSPEGMDGFVSQAAKMVGENRSDYVLFSTYVSNLHFSLAVAKEIKKRHPCRVVFGGPGCGLPETTAFMLKTGYVDAVVIGEGEHTICDLLENWEHGGEPPDIPGVASLQGGDQVFVPRKMVEDLDTLPRTIFHDEETRGAYLPLETSRGCVMR